MEIDFQHVGLQGPGVITFGEVVFTDEPKQPEQVRETVLLIGRPIGGNVTIKGSMDS